MLRRCRHAYSNPFPFPSYPNPQPHQIFHLPRSATQQQIKERYYDLVRIYHPDAPACRSCPPELAQTRFQSISKAYDSMRGKSAITGEDVTTREVRTDPARFRHRQTKRPHFDETAGDERWKERVLLGASLLAIVGFVVQTSFARQKVIEQATHDPRTGSSKPKHAVVDEALAEPTRSRQS